MVTNVFSSSSSGKVSRILTAIIRRSVGPLPATGGASVALLWLIALWLGLGWPRRDALPVIVYVVRRQPCNRREGVPLQIRDRGPDGLDAVLVARVVARPGDGDLLAMPRGRE